jgi:hypothetical protein
MYLSVKLGHRDVEVGEVVDVEDDSLRVAFHIAHAQSMPEGPLHARPSPAHTTTV